MNSKNCKCCGGKPGEISISFKPENQIFKVALCHRCFDLNRITGDFLATCLQHGPAGDFGKFREIRGDAKPDPLDDLAA
jgi:hypothetical protein